MTLFHTDISCYRYAECNDPVPLETRHKQKKSQILQYSICGVLLLFNEMLEGLTSFI